MTFERSENSPEPYAREALDFALLFDLSPNAYMVLDRNFDFVWANQSYLDATARSRDELIGRFIFDAFPQEPGSAPYEQLRDSLERVLRSRRSDHVPLIEYSIPAPGGGMEERFWSCVHTPVLDAKDEVKFIIQHALDVTELHRLRQIAALHTGTATTKLEGNVLRGAEALQQKHTALERVEAALRESEQRLREESEALEVLNATGMAVASELVLGDVVQKVTDAGVDLSGAEFGAFFYNVTNAAGESYMLYTLSGAPIEAFSKFKMPRNTAVFAPTFDGEGVVRSDDILKDPRYGKNDPHFGMPKGHLPVRSYLAVPVKSRSGEVIGGLFFGHSERGVFDERSERVLVGLAAQAAIALDNARLFDAAQRELEQRRAAEQALQNLNATLEEQVAERTAELRQRDEALRQAQKMEVVGQLTGGIAHDFNNLLQIVLGNLEILQRNLPEDAARLRRTTDNAINGARRAATLTQRLLAFSRRQPLAPRALSPNRLLNEMSELLHRTLGEAIEIETVLGAGIWNIEVDANQLESAILNLAVNARDAMPGGGKLTIETANARIDDDYAHRQVEVVPGHYVVICVSDTGTGMDRATRERAFEPFFTTKEAGRGTGLGLSMVYGFVKQSGGHVQIYSEPGHGTTVKIYLPRFRGEVSEEESSTFQQAPPEGTMQETILVLEDDADVRAHSVEILRELGYSVLEARDAEGALKLLERPLRIDLLFTDVVLEGGVTGADIARQAAALRRDLKVLFTTGYARDAIVHQGRIDRGVQLITKPFTYAELARRVRDVLDQAHDG